MVKQNEKFGVDHVFDTVTDLDLTGEVKKVTCLHEEYEAKAVILATGANPVPIGCPGEKEFSGKGVSYCAVCDGPFFRNKKIVVVGGGVKYSEAGAEVEKFCETFKIPFSETQSGKSACKSSNKYCLGGIGVTGTSASNKIAKQADCVISIGSRMSDFTTASKHLFRKAGVKFVSLNNNRYHAYKLDAVFAVGDAKANLKKVSAELKRLKYKSSYKNEIKDARAG